MILVHETSFNILIHFLSEKRLDIITVSQYNVERQYIYVLFFES